MFEFQRGISVSNARDCAARATGSLVLLDATSCPTSMLDYKVGVEFLRTRSAKRSYTLAFFVAAALPGVA